MGRHVTDPVATLGKRQLGARIYELTSEPVPSAIWEEALKRGVLKRGIPVHRIDRCEIAMRKIAEHSTSAEELKQAARRILDIIANIPAADRQRWRERFRWLPGSQSDRTTDPLSMDHT